MPGRSETAGGAPPLLGTTPRDLTLDDAEALLRSPYIRDYAPIVVGSAPVSFESLEREVTVIGTSASYAVIRNLDTARGRFLPKGDYRRAAPVAVIELDDRDGNWVAAWQIGTTAGGSVYKWEVTYNPYGVDTQHEWFRKSGDMFEYLAASIADRVVEMGEGRS